MPIITNFLVVFLTFCPREGFSIDDIELDFGEKIKKNPDIGGIGCDCTTALLKKEHIESNFIFPMISS